MVNKIQGIDYETALANLRASSLELRGDLPEKNELLSQFHPDYQADARVKLPIGPNQGDYCHPDLAKFLISQPLIDDYNLSGAEHLNTDVLVIGGGGAGAALSATEAGARVIMANKLRIGDSNTVMAEGGIQAAVGAEDSLQQHFDDTIKGGHNAGKKELVAQMVTDAPSAIRWLIGLGMTFDLAKGADSNGMLSRKRAGGTTVPRILSYRDFTGLEMMRVLREAVELDENITQLNRHRIIVGRTRSLRRRDFVRFGKTLFGIGSRKSRGLGNRRQRTPAFAGFRYFQPLWHDCRRPGDGLPYRRQTARCRFFPIPPDRRCPPSTLGRRADFRSRALRRHQAGQRFGRTFR